MAGAEIGYYTLPVIVSFKGIDAQVEDKLGKAMQDLGKKTGEQFGTAVVTAGLDPTKSPKVANEIRTRGGKKMGEAITTEVAKNIDGKKISETISASVQNAVQGGVGKKMGESVSTAITKDFDLKPLGKKIEEGLARAQTFDAKATGKKISDGLAGGIDVKAISGAIKGAVKDVDVKAVGGAIKGALKEPMAEAAAVAKEWGKQVGGELLAGNIKGAAADVDTVIKNTTSGINSLGKVVGLNLDSVEQFGTTAVTKIDSLASTAQNVVDRVTGGVADVKNTVAAVKALGSGDILTRLQGVSTALSAIDTTTQHFGVDVSGVTKPIASVADTAANVADTATALKTLIPAGTTAQIGALGARGLAGLGVGEEAVAGIGTAIGAALGPALAAAAILGGGIYIQHHIDEIWPSTGKGRGDINLGPLPPSEQQLAAAAAAAPHGPGRLPREGYSWQQDANGQWVERPALGAPGVATPGYVSPGPPGAPPPAPPSADDELNALNAMRAARGLPALEIPGQPRPAPPRPIYSGPPLNQPRVPEIFPATAAMAPGLEKFAATIGQAAVSAQVSAQTASINVGSATISGGISSPGVTSNLTRPGFKSWFQTGGGVGGPSGIDRVPILATAGEHMFTVDDVAAMGGQANVYAFRRSLHGLNGGGPPPAPPRWQPRRPIIPNRAAIKGVYYGGALGYDDGGTIRDVAGAIAPEVAAAAAEGAAKGAAAAGGMARGGSPLQASSGQDSLQFLTGMLGVAGEGAKETLGLGTVFPDPTANPNYRSLMALFSAFSGPIKGAMAGKLGIQQPGWRPGMPVAAMANNQASAGSIGLPFGLPSIDIPAAPAPGPPGSGRPSGAGASPGAGNTYNVDASINYHDGSVLGVDPAAQRAADTRTQERNLAQTVAPIDPANN